MAKWVLDPGHGGEDTGIVGVNGRRECDIVLEAVLEARRHLERNGEIVILTRDSDTSIDFEKRTEIANNWDADYFVSFHMNSLSDNLITGTEIFIIEKGNKAEKLARFIQDEVLSNLKSKNRGIKYYDDSGILKEVKIPSVLIKADFLSNEEVENTFDSKKYGYMIAKGCLDMVDKVLLEAPITKPKPLASKTWRICVGYYKEYNEAQNALEELVQNGAVDAYIVPYEG